MQYLQERHAAGEIVTGLLYLDAEASDIHVHLNTVKTPLNRLGEQDLCPAPGNSAPSTPLTGRNLRHCEPIIATAFPDITGKCRRFSRDGVTKR